MDAVQRAREAQGDRRVYQSLLQDKTLPPETVSALGAFLIETGAFRMSQYGLRDVAESGRMPDDFVPLSFAGADDAIREELCEFAQVQLEARADEALHRFLWNVVLGPYSADVRSAAWSSLSRWYGHERPAFKISKPAVNRFFESPDAFLGAFIEVLGEPVGLDKVPYFELVQSLLRYPDSDFLPLIVASPLAEPLKERLLEVMRDPAIRLTVRGACANFLGYLAGHEDWLVDIARFLSAFKGTDLEGATTQVLDQICRPMEDLGEGTREVPPETDFDYRDQIERYAALLKEIDDTEWGFR